MKLEVSSLIIFAFIVSKSWAIDPGILRTIQEVNQQNLVRSIQTCPEQLFIPYSATLQKNNPDYNDCMIALCGAPSVNPSAWVTDTNFSTNIPTALKSDVNKLDMLIKKVFEKSRKKSIEELDNLENVLSSSNIDQLDPNKFSPSFKDDFDSLIFKSHLEINIDKAKSSDKRVVIKLNIPEKSTDEFKKALLEYSISYKKYLLEDLSSDTARSIYTNEELYDLAKNKLKSAFAILEKSKGNLNKDQYNFIISEFQKAQDQISKESPGEFKPNDFFFTFDSAINIIPTSADIKVLQVEKPKCNSSECQKAYVGFLKNQNLRESIRKLKTVAQDPQVGNQYINRCKANIIATSMANTDHEKSRGLFERAKKDIISNVLPRFSEHSRKILSNYLTNELVFSSKKVIPVKDKNSIINEFKVNSQNYLKGSVENENNFLSFESSTESAIRKIILINSNFPDVDSISDQNSPCNVEMATTVWDSFLPVKMTKQIFGSDNQLVKSLPNKDHVFISDFSCTHEHRGKQNVAHEIGHALNHVFAHIPLSGESLAKYKSLRNCVTENYINPQANQTLISQPGDSIYTEEDAADLFAFITYPTEKNLFACSLVKPSNDVSSYTELSFILNEGDSHSTAFTRVIMEAINKNIELPVSCHRAILKDTPKLRFKKCF
jgi:hypothetical protein